MPGEVAGAEMGVWPLNRMEPGAVVALERIDEEGEHAQELLSYMDRHGLRPGARLTVAAVEPWAQTITLHYGDEQIVLGLHVAGQLWVRRLTAQDIARALAPVPTECPDETHGFVAEVTAVQSECPAGHQVSDRFVFGQRTPCGMCSEAFMEIYPHLSAVRTASQQGESVAVACPEHGNVTFRVRLARTEY